MLNDIKRTKIVCTLGPASQSEEVLKELMYVDSTSLMVLMKNTKEE